MKKILLIQSRTQPERIEQERINFTRGVGKNAALVCLSALDTSLAWKSPARLLKEYDGVIFGGSSDFDFNGGRDENDPMRLVSFIILTRVRNLITYALENNFPLLGVCFGHQILAEMRGGKIQNDKKQTKFGSFEVELNEEGRKDPLFSALPKKFFAQYAHNDSATKLPEGATLLGTGENCRFSILRYGPKAYTVQFHPEVDRMRLEKVPHHESPEASGIIPLWIERIVSSDAKPKGKSSPPRS